MCFPFIGVYLKLSIMPVIPGYPKAPSHHVFHGACCLFLFSAIKDIEKLASQKIGVPSLGNYSLRSMEVQKNTNMFTCLPDLQNLFQTLDMIYIDIPFRFFVWLTSPTATLIYHIENHNLNGCFCWHFLESTKHHWIEKHIFRNMSWIVMFRC